MSTEEIIQSWKQKPEKEPTEVPTSPAGSQELSDEELDLIEGGLAWSQGCTITFTCPDPV